MSQLVAQQNPPIKTPKYGERMQIKCDGTFTIKAKEDEGRVPLREAGLDFVSRGLIAGDRFEPTTTLY